MPVPPYNNSSFVRLPEEAALIRLAALGDQAAYGRLYSYYYPHLYTSLSFMAGSPEDAQEIIHEVFLKMWKTKESLALVRSFEDYAYTIAKNLLFNHLKRKKIGQRVIESLSDPSVKNTGPSPDQEYIYKQYYQAAVTAIRQLSGQKRRIFLLRTQEGMALEDIAREMGISVSTVKKHLYAALQWVKDALRQQMGELLVLLFIYFF